MTIRPGVTPGDVIIKGNVSTPRNRGEAARSRCGNDYRLANPQLWQYLWLWAVGTVVAPSGVGLVSWIGVGSGVGVGWSAGIGAGCVPGTPVGAVLGTIVGLIDGVMIGTTICGVRGDHPRRRYCWRPTSHRTINVQGGLDDKYVRCFPCGNSALTHI